MLLPFNSSRDEKYFVTGDLMELGQWQPTKHELRQAREKGPSASPNSPKPLRLTRSPFLSLIRSRTIRASFSPKKSPSKCRLEVLSAGASSSCVVLQALETGFSTKLPASCQATTKWIGSRVTTITIVHTTAAQRGPRCIPIRLHFVRGPRSGPYFATPSLHTCSAALFQKGRPQLSSGTWTQCA